MAVLDRTRLTDSIKKRHNVDLGVVSFLLFCGFVDVCSERTELSHDILISSSDKLDVGDLCLSLCRKSCNDKCRSCSQVYRFNRGAVKRRVALYLCYSSVDLN